MSIWQFNKTLTQRLLRLNIINIALGLPLLLHGGFWRGVGSQCIGWGLINIGIALGGNALTQRRRASLPDPDDPQVVAAEARALRRVLWVNAGLDILYMLGGQRLAATRGADNPLYRGVGRGITLQGGLLFAFDVLHALLTPGE
jgi:hypothetical protein